MQKINLVDFEALVKKWIDNTLSPSDLLVLHRYLKEESHRQIFEDIIAKNYDHAPIIQKSDQDWSSLFQGIENKIHQPKVSPFRKYMRYAAVAILIIIAAFSAWFLDLGSVDTVQKTESIASNTHGNLLIKDSKGGQAAWNERSEKKQYQDLVMVDDVLQVVPNNKELITYSLDNPRGSAALDIKLADGSLLTLNAGSSITFPNNFEENIRAVAMTGEILFEIAHLPTQPFVVTTRDLQVNVLGTVFNIKSFEGENSVETTLLEGKVNVSDQNGNSLLLKPGEQAVYKTTSKSLSKRAVQAENIVAWKDGYLILDNESLRDVLQKVERIYNVTCQYEDDFQDVKIWGTISTRGDLKEMLPLLERVSGVKLKLQQNKIMINQQ